MVNSFRDTILENLFPNYCALCGLRSYRPWPLCRPCNAEMTPNHTSCSRCGLPLFHRVGVTLCGRCLKHAPPFIRAETPWLYDEYMAFLIHRWKFHRDERLTSLLAQLWLEHSQQVHEVDVLVPVPLHWRRRWQRGYNQAELLARELLHRQPGLATAGLADKLLRRTRATPGQSGLHAAQRARNLHGAFTVKGRCDNLRIALVDDVLTTGATVSEAASTMLAAGAREVHVWCLARTPAPDY
jgi:ComF family protein